MEVRNPALAAKLVQYQARFRIVLDVGHRFPLMLPGVFSRRAFPHDVGRLRLLAAVVSDPETVHAWDVLPFESDLATLCAVCPLFIATELRQEGLPHRRIALRLDPTGELLDGHGDLALASRAWVHHGLLRGRGLDDLDRLKTRALGSGNLPRRRFSRRIVRDTPDHLVVVAELRFRLERVTQSFRHFPACG